MSALVTKGLGLKSRLNFLKWDLDQLIQLAELEGQDETAACLRTAQAAVLDGKDEIK